MVLDDLFSKLQTVKVPKDESKSSLSDMDSVRERECGDSTVQRSLVSKSSALTNSPDRAMCKLSQTELEENKENSQPNGHSTNSST